MEQLNLDGRITVSFNGQIHANCTSDADCPDQATCVVNAQWAAYNAMCTCSTVNSRYGNSCENLTPGGWAIFALYLVALLLACFASILLGYDISMLVRARIKFTFSAMQTTLIFLETASICMQGYIVFGLVDQLSPNILVLRGSGEMKRSSPTYVASNIFLAFTFFFETLGLLNISLVWVEIANASKTMSHRVQNNIQRFRLLLAGYYLFFGGAIIVFVALDWTAFVTYIVIPPIFFLLTTYIWGYVKMSRAAKSRSTSGSAKSSDALPDTKGSVSLLSSSRQNADGDRPPSELKRALRNMANTAFALVSAGSIGVALLIVQSVVNSVDMNTPTVPFTNIISRIVWICWAICLNVGAIYLHPLVVKAVKRAKEKKRISDSRNARDGLQSARASSRFLPHSVKSVRAFADMPPEKKRSLAMSIPGNPNEGMEVILNDEESSELRERFTEFVRAKYASETLNFYDACKTYKNKALTSNISSAKLAALGHQIIQDYVLESSVHAVNMEHALRNELILADTSKNFTPTTFENARTMAFELLKVNFYHQFRNALQEEELDEMM